MPEVKDDLLDDLLDNQWVRAGVAVALGFMAGRLRDAGVMRVLARTIIIAGVQSLAKNAFGQPRADASARWSSPRDLAVH